MILLKQQPISEESREQFYRSVQNNSGLLFYGMKCTQYFLHTRKRPDRRIIDMEWIARTVNAPEAECVQEDGRIRRWRQIPEARGKFLRVVLLDDGETVHNAFFDRQFK